MNKLDDKIIRENLINKLMNQSAKPKAIVEELRVHNGNAIADVVGLYNEAHCFEIKSDLDKIQRVREQSKFYNPSFPKISLVTTEKHLLKAQQICPPFWGILLAKENGDELTVRNVRKAKKNPEFCKKTALLALWKIEMLNFPTLAAKKYKYDNRENLIEILAANLGKESISRGISDAVAKRSNFSHAFNQETI